MITRRRWLECAALAPGAGAPRIDAGFPGGNIVVESIDGGTVSVHQDLRDTAGDWFYWAFRVTGAASRTLNFRFTRSAAVGVRGPAVSLDRGRSWRYAGPLGADSRQFTYAFPRGAGEVRFCMAIPYLEADLRAFLARRRGSRFLRASQLCRTAKGRIVELVEAGALDGGARPVVLLTARHHCCESIASYALEGLLAAVLDGGEPGDWLRRRVRFVAVPFMDKDGVEDGDQGKNRRPRDHNRDYDGVSVHASVAALRKLGESWPAGRLLVALDLHCPALRGANNEDLYFVGGQAPEPWAGMEKISAILEEIQKGPLRFSRVNNMPFGKAWNTAANYKEGMSFGRWTASRPGIRAAGTLEIPYANIGGVEVTAAAARLLGRDLARSLRRALDSYGQ